jgi:hypothetical protein
LRYKTSLREIVNRLASQLRSAGFTITPLQEVAAAKG